MEGKGKKDRKPAAVVSDDRFAKIHTDPRFKKFPKKTDKVEIDDRFASKSEI